MVPVNFRCRLIDVLILRTALVVVVQHPKNTGASSPRARRLLADLEAVLVRYGVPEPVDGWQAEKLEGLE